MMLSRQSAVTVALGGMLALSAAMGIGRFVYTPILPFMAEGVGLAKSEAGLIASANFLGYLLGALGAGLVALPGGRRRWALAALALSVLTTAGMGFATTLPAFLLLRFLGGVASAFVLILVSALVLDRLARDGRPRLWALHFGGVGIGIAASALLVALLHDQGYVWRDLWFGAGLYALLALLGVALLIGEEEPVVSTTAGKAARAKPDRRLWLLILAYGLFGFGYVITATFVSVMVRETPEIRSLETVTWLMVGLAGIPSVAFWGWISRRIGEAPAFALACLAEALGVAISVLVTGKLAILAAAILLGGTFMAITSVGLVRARQLGEGDPRRTIAFMTAAFGLGQMIGPSFAGYVHDLTGDFVLPSLAAAAALVVAAMLALIPAPVAQVSSPDLPRA